MVSLRDFFFQPISDTVEEEILYSHCVQFPGRGIDPRRRRWYAGIQVQEPKKRPQDRQFEVNTGLPSSGRALLERGYVGLVQLLDGDPLMLGPPDEGRGDQSFFA